MYYAFIGSFGVLSGVLLTAMGCKIMQILQLSSYRGGGVFAWWKKTKFDWLLRYFAAAFFSFVPMLVYVACFGKFRYVGYLGLLFYAGISLCFIAVTSRQKNKTPLRFTPRVIRLTGVTFVLMTAASVGLMYAENFMPVRYSLVGLLPLFVPFVVLAAHYVLLPAELLNNYGYEVKARKKLQRFPATIKIGITGSYGKTTAKNILAAMLREKYNVLATPASFNTPMGICKCINSELDAEYNVFIVEMGARYRGDIARLTKIVAPNIGIITAVGAQHLATFGSVDAICETKYDLIRGLAPSGLAVFSADNEHTLAMYERTQGEKRLAGECGAADACVTYEDVSFGTFGTRFTLRSGAECVEITTKLLGRHIPSLVSLCAAAALELGVTLPQIASAVVNLPQVEHRLQLMENGDVTVIDDAYNSNSAGAKNALEVLAAFEGTRIVITPGLVEMGAEEENANFALGAAVPSGAEYAYFVGGNGETLRRGALSAGMAEEKIFLCDTLNEAVKKTGEIAGRKTILFENDLPDNY